jgi:hypothetical protein
VTHDQKKAREKILKWCRKRGMRPVRGVRHVYPVAYVVGYAAERALIVARPWIYAEPHMRERDEMFPFDIIHTFDDALMPGQWCMTAYVSTATSGETVAIPVTR